MEVEKFSKSVVGTVEYMIKLIKMNFKMSVQNFGSSEPSGGTCVDVTLQK